MVTDDAERTMNTFLGASEALSAREIDQAALVDSEWFYVEGYLVTDEARTLATKAAVELPRRMVSRVAISLSDPFVVAVFGDALREVIGGGVDLIFCNKDEAMAFTGTESLEAAAESLKQCTKTFAITDGANGAITFDGHTVNQSKGVDGQGDRHQWRWGYVRRCLFICHHLGQRLCMGGRLWLMTVPQESLSVWSAA